jgi:hypothetical protein
MEDISCGIDTLHPERLFSHQQIIAQMKQLVD